MPKFERHSIVWKECGANSRYAERFFVPGFEGYLPFFIFGEELEKFENKKSVELKEDHLLKGILYGLHEFDNSPKPWHQSKDRETLLYLLDILGNGFNFESPEDMILNVAARIREDNGNSVSRIVLEVGKNLMPESSKIKCDLIFDLWAVTSERDGNTEFLKVINSLIDLIDLNDINKEAKEHVCYYGLCALVLLQDDQGVSNYLPKYIYPNVEMSKLKNNIKDLLENPEGFTAAELKID